MKQIFLFLFLFCHFLANAQSTKITSSANATTLKNRMEALGRYPGVMDYDDIYRAGIRGVYLGQNGSGLRIMLNSNDYSDVVQPSEITKAWTRNGLISWANGHYSVADYSEVVQGANTTISFRINGVLFTGTSNNEADASAIAFIAFLNTQ